MNNTNPTNHPEPVDGRTPILERTITRVENQMKRSDFSEVSIEVALQFIKLGGMRPVVEAVEAIRKEYAINGKSELYKTNKKALPSYCFGGTFNGYVDSEHLGHPSGVVLLDIDNLPMDEVTAIREKIQADPHTAFCFLSPSGAGLKVGVPLIGKIYTADQYKEGFKTVQHYATTTWGVEVDNTPDVSRLCYVSYDPDLYINESAEGIYYRGVTPADEAKAAKEDARNIRNAERGKVVSINTDKQMDAIKADAERKLDTGCENLRKAVEGNRYNMRRSTGFYIGGLVGGGLLDRELALAKLVDAALASTGTPDKAEKEVKKAFEQGIKEPISPDRFASEFAFDDLFEELGRFKKSNYEMDADKGLQKFRWESNRDGTHKKITTRICQAFDVLGRAREDTSFSGWGLILRWHDYDDQVHTHIISDSDCVGDSTEFARTLVANGFDIERGASACHDLARYLKTFRGDERVARVDKIGWHSYNEDSGYYVLPDRTIGGRDDNNPPSIIRSVEIEGEEIEVPEFMFYTEERHSNPYVASGELNDWKTKVSRLCRGNSRLLLAVSTVFASTILRLTGDENGGVHFVGDSSIGKSTIGAVAGSVFGGPNMKQTWNATLNGLGALAMNFNDNTMLLDELSQCDPYAAGEVAYMLSNGVEKGRAGRSGAAKKRKTWRMMFLSNGEIDLEQHLMAAGKKARAGQAVRLLSIPADAGVGLGAFEQLHEFDNAGLFADNLKLAAGQSYGVAGPAFVEAISMKFPQVREWFAEERRKFLDEHVPEDADPQVGRAARRFALIGLAGELATEHGVTGWDKGEALQAAVRCFQDWIKQRGGVGNYEEQALLDQFREHFERFGESRYEDANNKALYAQHITDRAGFREEITDREDGPAAYVYYVLTGTFKSLHKGFSRDKALKVLSDIGALVLSDKGDVYQRKQLPNGSGGFKQQRCYTIRGDVLFNWKNLNGSDGASECCPVDGSGQAPEDFAFVCE